MSKKGRLKDTIRREALWGQRLSKQEVHHQTLHLERGSALKFMCIQSMQGQLREGHDNLVQDLSFEGANANNSEVHTTFVSINSNFQLAKSKEGRLVLRLL